MLRDRGIQLGNAVAKKLLQEMQIGKYQGMDRLPPEADMATDMGVSRTAIRDGVAILEREGFITRKWGIGTLINQHVLKVTNRLDMEGEFLNIVSRAGYTPRIGTAEVVDDIADQRDAEILRVEEGSPVFRVFRTILADDDPVIYCRDTFSKQLIQASEYDREELKKPIFYFLEKYCHVDVFLDLTVIHAVNATGRIKEQLQVEEQEAVLYMNEVGYDLRGNVILQSDEYYNDDKLVQTVLRKRIDL